MPPGIIAVTVFSILAVVGIAGGLIYVGVKKRSRSHTSQLETGTRFNLNKRHVLNADLIQVRTVNKRHVLNSDLIQV